MKSVDLDIVAALVVVHGQIVSGIPGALQGSICCESLQVRGDINRTFQSPGIIFYFRSSTHICVILINLRPIGGLIVRTSYF
jgi:hypothetical protein